MLKKLLTAALTAAVCLSAAGCSSGPEGYSAIKKAQEGAAALESGRVIATSSYAKGNKSGSITTELLFLTNGDGSISYCQTQFDRDNKAVYCEYCDGKQVERWLIGKGWSSPEAGECTKENPHRYLRLLGTPIDPAAIDAVTKEEDGENCRYVVALRPEWLNENTYTSGTETAVSETVTLLLGPDGKLMKWADEAVVTDTLAKQDCTYRLEMELTGGGVTAITKPELRDNFRVGADTPTDAEADAEVNGDADAEADAEVDAGADVPVEANDK